MITTRRFTPLEERRSAGVEEECVRKDEEFPGARRRSVAPQAPVLVMPTGLLEIHSTAGLGRGCALR